jgi:hypothetical protein
MAAIVFALLCVILSDRAGLANLNRHPADGRRFQTQTAPSRKLDLSLRLGEEKAQA